MYLCLSQTKLLENIDVLIKYLPREMLYTLINSHSILPSNFSKNGFFPKRATNNITVFIPITVFINDCNVFDTRKCDIQLCDL